MEYSCRMCCKIVNDPERLLELVHCIIYIF